MIIGRTTELKYLNNYYDRAGSQILVVYGQKHVGKKALLKEFVLDKPHYYYCARACVEREQQFSKRYKEKWFFAFLFMHYLVTACYFFQVFNT